jgi:hypothetical protein
MQHSSKPLAIKAQPKRSTEASPFETENPSARNANEFEQKGGCAIAPGEEGELSGFGAVNC